MDKHLLTVEEYRSIKTFKKIKTIVGKVSLRKWHLSKVQKKLESCRYLGESVPGRWNSMCKGSEVEQARRPGESNEKWS